MSPVAILGFFDERSITLPVTWTTHSRPSLQAVSRASAGDHDLRDSVTVPEVDEGHGAEVADFLHPPG